jgi:hypothetical protein
MLNPCRKSIKKADIAMPGIAILVGLGRRAVTIRLGAALTSVEVTVSSSALARTTSTAQRGLLASWTLVESVPYEDDLSPTAA